MARRIRGTVATTLACGIALCVAGVLAGRTGRCIEVRSAGGTLQAEWADDECGVRVSGPAHLPFRGEWHG